MKRTVISAPEGYENRVTLFQTVWQIHSGEIFGLPGKIYVDIMGGVTLFLSVTGIIYFFFPGWIKRRFRREDSTFRLVKISTWSLKWHNKVGAWTFILLIILFFSGMFLRPPLLLAIANAGLKPLKFTHLDQPNPWYDKLRDIKYDVTRKVFFLSTSDGMYLMDPLKLKPVMCAVQPPVSVMGINSFESYHGGSFLVGSFSGLYLWNPDKGIVTDFLTGLPAIDNKGGRPAGDFKITGTVTDSKGNFFIVEYDKGVIPIAENASFPQMPGAITGESPMSLWNFCLEVHTGRIFQGLFGDFYILIVPLTGIAGIVIVISGYMVWRRRYRKK